MEKRNEIYAPMVPSETLIISRPVYQHSWQMSQCNKIGSH